MQNMSGVAGRYYQENFAEFKKKSDFHFKKRKSTNQEQDFIPKNKLLVKRLIAVVHNVFNSNVQGMNVEFLILILNQFPPYSREFLVTVIGANVSTHQMLDLAVAAMECVWQDRADAENDLFRGNSVLTTIVRMIMQHVGLSYVNEKIYKFIVEHVNPDDTGEDMLTRNGMRDRFIRAFSNLNVEISLTSSEEITEVEFPHEIQYLMSQVSLLLKNVSQPDRVIRENLSSMGRNC